jgi:hypothetical protein
MATANAHVVMKSPIPYSVDKLDNSPITKAQFPCKSQNGFSVSTMNQMKVGAKNTLELSGSAVHGGGSCQLSVSLDMEPTASSVFKVIKSMEGGCPGVDSAAGSYDFELPDSIPNGNATFAWTWMSKLSGGPELYMYVSSPSSHLHLRHKLTYIIGTVRLSKSAEVLATSQNSMRSLTCWLSISTIPASPYRTSLFNFPTPALLSRRALQTT